MNALRYYPPFLALASGRVVIGDLIEFALLVIAPLALAASVAYAFTTFRSGRIMAWVGALAAVASTIVALEALTLVLPRLTAPALFALVAAAAVAHAAHRRREPYAHWLVALTLASGPVVLGTQLVGIFLLLTERPIVLLTQWVLAAAGGAMLAWLLVPRRFTRARRYVVALTALAAAAALATFDVNAYTLAQSEHGAEGECAFDSTRVHIASPDLADSYGLAHDVERNELLVSRRRFEVAILDPATLTERGRFVIPKCEKASRIEVEPERDAWLFVCKDALRRVDRRTRTVRNESPSFDTRVEELQDAVTLRDGNTIVAGFTRTPELMFFDADSLAMRERIWNTTGLRLGTDLYVTRDPAAGFAAVSTTEISLRDARNHVTASTHRPGMARSMYDPRRNRFLMAWFYPAHIEAYDGTTLERIASTPLRDGPHYEAKLSPDHAWLALTHFISGNLSLLDAETLETIDFVRVGRRVRRGVFLDAPPRFVTSSSCGLVSVALPELPEKQPKR